MLNVDDVSSSRQSKIGSTFQKTDFLSNVERYKLQQNFLEKCQIATLKSLDPNFISEVNALQLNLDCHRNEETGNLEESLSCINDRLKQLKLDVEDQEALKHYGLEHYRKAAFDIEDKISSFKESSYRRLQELEEEEMKLTNEIKSMNDKLEEWNKPDLNKSQSSNHQYISSNQSQDSGTVAPEVQKFKKYVYEHGGHNGGWEDVDHILFLQIRRKHRGRPQFIDALAPMLPHMTITQIEQHESWYSQYTELKDKHLRAIDDWRTKKLREKKKKPDSPQLQLDNEIKQQKDLIEKQSVQMKSKIEEWKKEKELKKELEELEKLEEKQRQLESERKKAMRQAKMKAEVEQYKMEKMTQEQAAQLSRQMKELREIEKRASEANMLIKTFRQQNDAYIAKQKAIREAREKKLQEQLKSVEVPPLVEASKDPERLLRATEVWKEHCKKPEPEIKPVLHLRNMPKLAVPQWRKGLNRF